MLYLLFFHKNSIQRSMLLSLVERICFAICSSITSVNRYMFNFMMLPELKNLNIFFANIVTLSVLDWLQTDEAGQVFIGG